MRTRPGLRGTRTLGVLVLLALLAPPLALGGHHHGKPDPARDCSTCVVAHCSPAEAVSAIALPGPAVSHPAPPSATPAAVTSFDPPAHPGRAPPIPLAGSAA
jgi:hypothetical protein